MLEAICTNDNAGTVRSTATALASVVAAALLLYEHSLVKPHDLRRLDAAFFAMNGIISIAFFVFVLIERLLRPGGGPG